jgi:hypothetical protein
LIAIEALINNLVPKNLLNLVPVETEQTSFFGFYQRPMGFAGNASMTAGVMHMMWAIRQDMKIYFKFEYLFVGLSMIILASGFGIILFILQLLIYFNKLLTQVVLRSLFLTLPIVLFYIFNLNFDIIAYLSSGEVSDANKEAGFYKLDFSYIEFLIQLKTEQLTDNLSEVASLLIGNQHLMNIPQTSGDFGYYTIFSTVGFIGFLVLFLIPISYVKRIIYFPRSYIILFLSFLHYPGLLTPVGQVVLAFFILI